MLRCPPPAPAGRGATEPDQDLLLGLRLSQAGETGLPGDCICHRLSWGWCLGAEPVCLQRQGKERQLQHPRVWVRRFNVLTHSHFFARFFVFLPCRSAPTLSSPLTAGERAPVLLGKVPALVEWVSEGPANCQSPERWGRGGNSFSSASLSHPSPLQRDMTPHL